MALPLILPAASAIAKASGVALASGLTTKLLLDKIRSNYDTGNTEEIRNELMRRNNIGIGSHTKSTTSNIPSAENALVLRPEYRTVITPTEFIGYKPFRSDETPKSPTNEGNSQVSSEGTAIGDNNPNPKKGDEDEKKNEQESEKSAFNRGWNKQGLLQTETSTLRQQWKRVGQNIGYGIGRSARFVSSPGFVLPTGIIGGSILGSYIATRHNNTDLSNQIDTVATRKNNSDKIYIAEIAE